MKVELFDFDLPKDRIALKPASPRDSARLLHIRGDGLDDKHVRDLPSLLRPSDLLVLNNTKVIPARLLGKRGDAKVEVTLHKAVSATVWHSFAKPGKRLRVGDTVIFAEDLAAKVQDKLETGEVVLAFDVSAQEMMPLLARYGAMPLPPYIARDTSDAHDAQDYQTIYAQKEGAVAAPTAGLHFTEDLFAALKQRGIGMEYVTLHVGAGTFLPVKAEDTQEHVMHYEWVHVDEQTAHSINAAKAAGRRIVAVGTTSLRVLESASDGMCGVRPMSGETNLFITPGYTFNCVDALLTNFHLPKSTLFMLVSAFAGLERMKSAYQHAIEHNYRFYSYGDACLLER